MSWIDAVRTLFGAAARPGAALSRQHVLWAYRLLLDREAGPLDDIDGKLATFTTARELRTAFLSSPEYAHFNSKGSAFLPASGTAIAELPGDLRLFVDLADRAIGVNVLLGNYELEEVEFVRSCVAPGAHVLDIGANIGYFSILMANWVGSTGSVTAFEPVPANLHLLSRSIAENGFENRVRVIASVIADVPGEAELLTADVRFAFNSGGSFLVKEGVATPRDHRRIRVTKAQLDALELPRPVSFMKMDVEGAEALALRGARRILSADRPKVLAEINPQQLLNVSGMSAEALISEMSGLGYECRVLEQGRPGEPISSTEALINVVFLPCRA